MPHVIVKLWPGKPQQQKARLAGKIPKGVMRSSTTGKSPFRSHSRKSHPETGKRRSMNRISRATGKNSSRSPAMRCETVNQLNERQEQ
jgi:hypothetical protein